MSLTLTLERGSGGAVSGSGTNIELDGTIAGGAIESVKMYGDTEQAASPTPDFPQEVQTVTGRQVVTISDGGRQSQEYEINLGKNLFNKDNISILNGYFEYSGDTIHSQANNRVFYISCEPNTRYSITQGTSTLSSHVFQIATTSVTPAVGVAVSGFFSAGSNNIANYLTASDAKYMVVRIRAGDNVSTFLDGVQIEKGSSITTYAPYFTPIELCKIGDYQDYIYKSGDDWYVHKETQKISLDGTESYEGIVANPTSTDYYYVRSTAFDFLGNGAGYKELSDRFVSFGDWFNYETAVDKEVFCMISSQDSSRLRFMIKKSRLSAMTTAAVKTWFSNNNTVVYYALATPTDTKITDATLIGQLNALNAADTYDGTTVITVASENLASPLEVKVSTSIAKIYTEVEIGSPFTISDVEGKSSTTTLNGNVYVDFAYSKKAFQVDIFNLSTSDYSDIRAFYDYQFTSGKFITLSIPELSIANMPVYMEMSKRNIVSQCLTTDKLTLNFRETVQP
jgi:hypothetical protein